MLFIKRVLGTIKMSAEEVQAFIVAFLTENPNSVALQVGKALHEKYPDKPASRKTGNQILYALEKKNVVRSDRTTSKPTWSVV